MFGFNKKSGSTESLFINVLIFGTILSGLAMLQFDSYTNKLMMLSGENHGVKIEVNINSETSEACGMLGCFEMRNVTFKIEERKDADGHLRNQYVNYMENVKIDCEIDSVSDNSMIYWVGSRKNKFFSNTSYFNVGGYFYENYTTVNERKQLYLQNVSGYENRYFACILFQKNTATIKYSYLTVVGDPVERHYTDERFDKKETDSLSGQTMKTSQIAGIIAAAIGLLMTIIITMAMTVYRRRNVIVKYWSKKVTVEKPLSETGDLVMPIVRIEKQRLTQVGIKGNNSTLMSEYQMPVDPAWEIPRSRISVTGQVLGEGEFGKVLKAESHGMVSDDKTIVAVKMLKDGYTDADMVSLVSEMEVMKVIGKHENIINLLGCCTQDGPVYFVMEYARNGSLRDYLKQHKRRKNASMDNLLDKLLSQRELMEFVWQVAKGMEYLASRGCIHRDLAARNVLVSEDLILKIADFGLARDVRDTKDYYRKRTPGKLPMKWMAPESIAQNYYDKRSDVWSFGVITWEIMTFGEMPYAKISIYNLYNHLVTNKRLEQPVDCSDEMYNFMRSCWAFKPEDRPTFEDIVGTMKTMLNLRENGPLPENLNEYETMLS